MRINTHLALGLNLAAGLSLTACQSTGPVGVQVREVEVPTPVPCVDKASIPAEPEQVRGKLTGDAVADLSIVAASALELRRWGQEQNALLQGCVE